MTPIAARSERLLVLGAAAPVDLGAAGQPNHRRMPRKKEPEVWRFLQQIRQA
jgi:hypothetical protein